MIRHGEPRGFAVAAVLFLALAIPCECHAAPEIGQDAQEQPASPAAKHLLAKLKSACESNVALHGALVQGAEPREGKLFFTGTIDRAEQAVLIEAEASRVLDESPRFRAQIAGGASASRMVLFPIKSDWLLKLQADFAGPGTEPPRDPTLFQQTRLDDLYFDTQGKLRVVGLCINQHAYIVSKGAAEGQEESPVAAIGRHVYERLKTYPLPEQVDHKILSRVFADQITFEQNPVRLLQRFANESKLDDVLFREAWFNARGELRVDGLLGDRDQDQRALAADFVSRPLFLKAYGSPAGASSLKAADVVAPMSVNPWQAAFIAAVRKRCASEENARVPTSILRHCRIDRCSFLYGERGLTLRFEGLWLRGIGDGAISQLSAVIQSERKRSIAVNCSILPSLTQLPNPLRELQLKAMNTPALDGVRLDDFVFGPAGEPTLVGKWVTEAQRVALDQVLTPVVLEQTGGKVEGPLAVRMTLLPTDRLLRGFRKKMQTSPSETSLDRLYFRPLKDAVPHPQMVLQGATLADRLTETRAQLEGWLKSDPLMKEMGSAKVELAPRPKSLLAELRKLVAADPALDGVLIKTVSFDEENGLVLTGRQDHPGQAQGAVQLVEKAALRAWKGLPPPKSARAGEFQVYPLRALLKKLAIALPAYDLADGVILDRAYYNDQSELVLAGRDSRSERTSASLKQLIEKLVREETDIKLATPLLTPQRRDDEKSAKIVGRGVEFLCAGTLANFPVKDLDEAIFLDPADSTAWYLRGAFYLVTGNGELAKRDLARAHGLEKASKSRFHDRARMLERFQTPLRIRLEELMSDL